jgi:hypothetical protein
MHCTQLHIKVISHHGVQIRDGSYDDCQYEVNSQVNATCSKMTDPCVIKYRFNDSLKGLLRQDPNR